MENPFIWSPVASGLQQGAPSPLVGRNDFAPGQAGGNAGGNIPQPAIQQPLSSPYNSNPMTPQIGIPQHNGGQSLSGRNDFAPGQAGGNAGGNIPQPAIQQPLSSPYNSNPMTPQIGIPQHNGAPSPLVGRNDFAPGQAGGNAGGNIPQPAIQQPLSSPYNSNPMTPQIGIPQHNGGQSLSGLGQTIGGPQYSQYAPLASLQGLQGPAYNVNSNPMAGNARDGSFFLPWQQYGFGSIGF